MSPTIAIDNIIVWDPCLLKQVEEAKQLFLKYKKMGHTLTKEDGTPMERFDPSVGQVTVLSEKANGQRVMKILSEKGDDRITWDKDNLANIKKAKDEFEKLLEKGYQAFSVGRNGQKNVQITEFDVDAEEIIMIPPTAKG